MEIEEKKVEDIITPIDEEEDVEVIEIEDQDAGLKPEDVELVKEETQKKVREEHVLTKEQQKIFTDMLKAADMPVKLDDVKFEMGKKELDIRGLSRNNKEQMFFRSMVLDNVYNKQILTSLIDITRLLMILCDQLGVEDIVGATDRIIEKIEKQRAIKKQLKSAVKNNKA